ncbi:hypothetical protein EV361DRAFT_995240 [Lentinula raphanica]|nr:hypothetical protein EV361DRAFT_995240 [Lentinula raphanica]
MDSPSHTENHQSESHPDFEATIFLLRTVTKTFNVPRMDCFYNSDLDTIRLSVELPGIRRDNLRVILYNDAVLRQRGIQVWGFTVPPQWELGGGGNNNPLGSATMQPSNLLPPAADPALSLRLNYGCPPNFSTRERKHGEFYWFFPLPAKTTAKDIRVELNAGVLTISVVCPKPLTAVEMEILQEDIRID